MKTKVTIQTFGAYDPRLYETPWVRQVGLNGLPDFFAVVGGYSGDPTTGGAGDLYLTTPMEGMVYVYGQSARDGSHEFLEYRHYRNGKLVPLDRLLVRAYRQWELKTHPWEDPD